MISRSPASRCLVLLRHLRKVAPTMAQVAAVSTSSNDEVLFERVMAPTGRGCYQLTTLNRPKALNALNDNMAILIQQNIQSAEQDDSVQCYVMKGAGEKAFCAGGDIRAITEAGRRGDPLAQTFFRHEYTLNYTIGSLSKPHVAILDGVTMGGGVGLSVHGPFRVATEKTLFAMPETAIGFFTDVGGSYFLPRLKDNLGMFLGLTGYRLKGRDVYYAGVASHYIPCEKILELEKQLSVVCGELCTNGRGGEDRVAAVRKVLDGLHNESKHVDAASFSLDPYIDVINRCFNQPSVEAIFDALRAEKSEWATAQLEKLHKMSPTAMKVTHRELLLGKTLSFKDCFRMEYRISQGCMAGKDFYEGVRAVLVDRDNAPKWDPPTLAEVTNKIVDHHFKPLGDKDLIL